MPTLSRICIYPIKSLDPVMVPQARVLRSGALQHDRRWALVDASGKVINGKRTPLVHRLRVEYAEHFHAATFAFEGNTATFQLDADPHPLEQWLSQVVFDQPVRLLENQTTGYPDDTEAPGPTVISTATLGAVSQWFSPLNVDLARLRFRANLEIDCFEAFWEDRLYGPAGSAVEFTVGQVRFAGTNPCARCVVPTRDAYTGEVTPQFVANFTRHRQATLPPWADRSRFDHFYRLAVNTHLMGPPGIIALGDEVRIHP